MTATVTPLVNDILPLVNKLALPRQMTAQQLAAGTVDIEAEAPNMLSSGWRIVLTVVLVIVGTGLFGYVAWEMHELRAWYTAATTTPQLPASLLWSLMMLVIVGFLLWVVAYFTVMGFGKVKLNVSFPTAGVEEVS